MISLEKKRKCVKIYYNFYNHDNELFLEFNNDQLDQIKKCIYMEYKIKDKIIKNIPTNINKIVFGGWFNLDAQPYLHSNIQMIKFGYEFNQLVNNLPSKLKHLTLGVKFNQSIDNLPNGLKKLFFGGNFNQPINMLSESLEIIYLSGGFNQPVDNLPNRLKMLIINGFAFNHSIDSLPDSIEFLQLHPQYKIPIIKFPKKLLLIKFICNSYVKCKIDLEKIKKITNANIEL